MVFHRFLSGSRCTVGICQRRSDRARGIRSSPSIRPASTCQSNTSHSTAAGRGRTSRPAAHLKARGGTSSRGWSARLERPPGLLRLPLPSAAGLRRLAGPAVQTGGTPQTRPHRDRPRQRNGPRLADRRPKGDRPYSGAAARPASRNRRGHPPGRVGCIPLSGQDCRAFDSRCRCALRLDTAPQP